MIRRFIVGSRAEKDIQSAFEWYESQRAGLGDQFLAAVHEKLNLVRDRPEGNPVACRDVRRAVVSRFPYLIFYLVRRTRVTVLAVLHHARDPVRWPRRGNI